MSIWESIFLLGLLELFCLGFKEAHKSIPSLALVPIRVIQASDWISRLDDFIFASRMIDY